MNPPSSSADLPPELQLVEGLRDGFILFDADRCVSWVNARGRTLMRANGYDPDAILGASLWAVWPEAVGSQLREALADAVRAGEPRFIEYYHPQTGKYFELDLVPLGQRLGLYWRDISARRAEELERAAARAELMAAHRRVDDLLQGAPLAIIAIDNDANVLTWNPAAERMFQWSAGELLGRPLPTVPEEERAAAEGLRARERAGEVMFAVPARRCRKDGVVLDVQVSTAPLRDAAGTVVGVVRMLADVTEQRRLESQLRMAQKMEAVGLLAGGVAHDFNNLLTAIKGFASLLEMTLPPEEQAPHEFLREIDKAADRAAALTSQLLAFSRRQLLRPEPIDLNARVRDLERMVRLLVHEHGELVLDLSPDVGAVLADPGQVEQVIMNLAVNARDAVRGRHGGRIIVRTSEVELRDEFEGWGVTAAPGAYVRLDVADNGVGMDRATQARIFDPFFTTKQPGEGTGLGLATVFGMVKQSGGYVWVESQPGEGSTFSVYLPRARTERRAPDVIRAVAEPHDARVLLVEDEAAVRRVARRALELHGFAVLEASDGTEALARFGDCEFDILVTDVMMPGMLGPALAESLRRRHPGLPVLFMSGHTDEITRGGLLDPATPFIAKPYTPAQLAHRVRETLGAAHS